MATGRPNCEGLGLGWQPYALPGSCRSPSLTPSLLVAASDVYRKIKWTGGLADPWHDLRLPIPDERAAGRVNGGCRVVTGTSRRLVCTSPLLGQVGVPGERGTLFGGDGAPHTGSEQPPGNQKQLPCMGHQGHFWDRLDPTSSKSKLNVLWDGNKAEITEYEWLC